MPRVTFAYPDGTSRALDARAGQTLLAIAWEHDIGIEGACEGCMSCSTCHVIVAEPFFSALPEPSEEEEDLLDLAFGVLPTSRLGCQIVVTDALDGLVVTLPAATNNLLRG